MPRFAANLGFLFPELRLLDRFAAARRCGFTAVEIHGPENATAGQIAAAAAAANVQIVLCNAPVADFVSGGAGLSGVAHRREEFRQAVRDVRDFARAVGCTSVNVGPSRVLDPAERSTSFATLTENLRFAGEHLAEAGIRALVEPLNPRDFADVLLCDIGSALQVIQASRQPNVFLQFDLYHVQQMIPDPLAVLEANLSRVGHMQFADVPGRGPPGTGYVDFAAFFAALDVLGYTGWVGAEYRPGGSTESSLGWFERYR